MIYFENTFIENTFPDKTLLSNFKNVELLNNQHEINKFLKDNQEKIKNIQEDYIVAELCSSTFYGNFNFNDMPLEMFSVEYKNQIDEIYRENKNVVITIYDDRQDALYEGILNIKDKPFSITDILGNKIILQMDYMKRKSYSYKIREFIMIKKEIKIPTIKDFLTDLKNNPMLYNTKIVITPTTGLGNGILTIYVNESGDVIKYINSNRAILNPDDIPKYFDEHILRVTTQF